MALKLGGDTFDSTAVALDGALGDHLQHAFVARLARLRVVSEL